MKYKNVKISENHHIKLKDYCDRTGMKMHRMVEKWIDNLLTEKKTDIYGER